MILYIAYIYIYINSPKRKNNARNVMSTHHDFNMACIEHLPSTFGSWAWRLQWRSKSMRTSLQEERTSASLRSKLSAWVSCHSFGRRQERWLNPNNRTAVTWLNKIFLIEENLWLSWFLDTFLLDTLFFLEGTKMKPKSETLKNDRKLVDSDSTETLHFWS